MANGDERPDDMYCFRCTDRENSLETDLWVDVDIPWEEFSLRLARTFGRSVNIVYYRSGETQERRVQTEDDFEDLCDYLDDTQVRNFRHSQPTRKRIAARALETAE